MSPSSRCIRSGTCSPLPRHVIGTSFSSRTGNPFTVRISAASRDQFSVQGPSCIYVGPIETASQETLEALYRQARDAYYSGQPLIVDDMFDRVELKLRWYGSKCVVKYPRCSLRRHSAYSDAEEDLSQVLTLASIWALFLAIASSACAVPILYTIALTHQGNHAPVMEFRDTVNGALFMVFGSVLGYPIASASVKVLQGLWRNDLAALRGACPNCGEEVFAFVKSEKSGQSPHRADCHVCESLLEFRTKAEIDSLGNSISKLGRRWVHGRIFLVTRRNRHQRWL